MPIARLLSQVSTHISIAATAWGFPKCCGYWTSDGDGKRRVSDFFRARKIVAVREAIRELF
jgi:hypothetical protein